MNPKATDHEFRRNLDVCPGCGRARSNDNATGVMLFQHAEGCRWSQGSKRITNKWNRPNWLRKLRRSTYDGSPNRGRRH